jgi:hypothetical protein
MIPLGKDLETLLITTAISTINKDMVFKIVPILGLNTRNQKPIRLKPDYRITIISKSRNLRIHAGPQPDN